jgi:hypothetical protein
MIMSIKNSVLKYLQLAKSMPEFLDNSRKQLNQSKFILDNLILRSPDTITPFFNNQLSNYSTADKELRDLSQKHAVSTGMLSNFPDFRDKYLSGQNSLDMVNVPVIMAITIMSGSVLTLYESVSFKINQLSNQISLTEAALNKYTAGQMTLTEFTNYVNGLKDMSVKPAVSFGQVLLVAGLIFGGYYAVSNSKEVKKFLA